MTWTPLAAIAVTSNWKFTPAVDSDLGYIRLDFGVGNVRRTLLGVTIWIAQVDLDSVSGELYIYDERRVVASFYNQVLEFECPPFMDNRGVAIRCPADFSDLWTIHLEVSDVPLTRNNGSVQNITSTVANTTTVPASATVVELLEANPNRKTAAFQCSAGSAVLYLKTADDASATDHTVFLFGGDFYELNIPYTGVISGIWSSAAGSVLVTEFV